MPTNFVNAYYKDVYIIICLHYAVRTSLYRMHLGMNKLSEQHKCYIDNILKVSLNIFFIISVRKPCKKLCKSVLNALKVGRLYITSKVPYIKRLFILPVKVRWRKTLYKAVFYLIIRISKLIAVWIF